VQVEELLYIQWWPVEVFILFPYIPFEIFHWPTGDVLFLLLILHFSYCYWCWWVLITLVPHSSFTLPVGGAIWCCSVPIQWLPQAGDLFCAITVGFWSTCSVDIPDFILLVWYIFICSVIPFCFCWWATITFVVLLFRWQFIPYIWNYYIAVFNFDLLRYSLLLTFIRGKFHSIAEVNDHLRILPFLPTGTPLTTSVR